MVMHLDSMQVIYEDIFHVHSPFGDRVWIMTQVAEMLVSYRTYTDYVYQ